MTLDPSYGWLIAGAIFLALEAFGIPGIGFLFAGLGAVLAGLLIHLGIMGREDWVGQFGLFFAATAFFAVLLWKKLKSWRLGGKGSGDYHNIIGDMGTVGKDGIHKGKTGQVSWSGTTMMAELAENAPQNFCAQGEMVKIVAVKGNKLIITPLERHTEE